MCLIVEVQEIARKETEIAMSSNSGNTCNEDSSNAADQVKREEEPSDIVDNIAYGFQNTHQTVCTVDNVAYRFCVPRASQADDKDLRDNVHYEVNQNIAYGFRSEDEAVRTVGNVAYGSKGVSTNIESVDDDDSWKEYTYVAVGDTAHR